MPIKEQQFTPAIWFELKLTPKSTPIGYFTEVSGLASEIEVMTFNEGGKNDGVHKLPTRMKHPNLVLKRGVTNRAELEMWFDKVAASPEQKTIQLTMYNEGLDKVRGWSFENAYPVKWTGPTFNVGQNQFATEAIEIAHEGIKVVPV
jgi:phage tail-like protein